jgi:DNA repair photolyase
MQSETDYTGEEFSAQAKEAYEYFMRVDPDMREMLGPIEETEDETTGRTMRSRLAKVAMIRGATDLHETRVYLDPFPHIRQAKGKDLQGWYSAKDDGAKQGMRERPCETDAILTQPYGGYCTVGCQFCYINSGTRGYRGSGLITVPMDYGAHVRKQLRSMRVSAAGYFSSFIDPFLSIEDYYHNTRHGAQAFLDAGLPIFFLSRLHYPGWAIDMLEEDKYSYAQKSLNTSNPETWHLLSPGAIPLDDHLEEIRLLRQRGIYTSIQCNPIIPGVVDHEDVEGLFERLASVGNNHVIVKFVEAGYAWAKAMVGRIQAKFPGERGDTFARLFAENQAGGQRTIIEEYRREAHERYQRVATKLGMTYSLCYEYTKKSGTWKSMGPEFLTADQCHGHRVPMFEKHDDETDLFKEMTVCPPSGCLHCGDGKTESLCGSDILTSAPALRLPQLRKPWNVIPLKQV